ncbi:MAG: hypothetical protein QF471_04480, partial [Phycisphaerales bacterium]|nr:hypothetical protein [Phycisphaerales bacterium]
MPTNRLGVMCWLCVGLAAECVYADTLVRQDGRVYEGELVSQTATYVQFKTKLSGNSKWCVVPIPMTDVLRIDEEPGDQAVDQPEAAPPSAGASVEGDHRVEDVLARGSGRSEREAIDNALRAAVEQVVGLLITGRTQVENVQVVEDRLISHANGFVRTYTPVGAVRNTGTPSDPHFEVRILAEVEITKIFEQLKSENVEFRESFDAESIYARVTTKQNRDKAAAETLAEVFADYPNRVWTVKPVGKVREAGFTESGEVILAAKVRFEKTKGQWASFAGDLKRVLSKISTGKDRIRTSRTKYSLAGSAPSQFVEQLNDPPEVRAKMGLQDNWGLTSIDHRNRKQLRQYWPVLRDYYHPLQSDKQIGYEDMVVLVDQEQRSADVWAVPEMAWNEVHQAVARPPEVFVSLVDERGSDIGRPLFGREQQVLEGRSWSGPGNSSYGS